MSMTRRAKNFWIVTFGVAVYFTLLFVKTNYDPITLAIGVGLVMASYFTKDAFGYFRDYLKQKKADQNG